jgi:hypothetical protein
MSDGITAAAQYDRVLFQLIPASNEVTSMKLSHGCRESGPSRFHLLRLASKKVI